MQSIYYKSHMQQMFYKYVLNPIAAVILVGAVLTMFTIMFGGWFLISILAYTFGALVFLVKSTLLVASLPMAACGMVGERYVRWHRQQVRACSLKSEMFPHCSEDHTLVTY